MSENAVRQNRQLVRTDSMYGISNIDTAVEGTSDDMTVVDAASLRRQIIKLNRCLQLLEEENKECAKREMVMYSITIAFWLLNSGFAARGKLSSQKYCFNSWKYKEFEKKKDVLEFLLWFSGNKTD
uniref:Mitochondrial fission factor n=1 Tax=Sus scrofa TaxID=9823 RepID=A0A8D1BZD0_PIG